MRVLVAGATGVIGRRVARLLVMQGHQVVGTTHRADKVDLVRRLGAEPVVLDGLDAVVVRDVVGRVRPDVIVDEMTALARSSDMRRFDRWFAATNELRTRGTDLLLAAAQASGVSRFVAQSFTGWTNARTGRLVKNEEDEFEPFPFKEQSETLDALVHLERAVVGAPLDGIVLRYGNLYGPGASDEIVAMVRRRLLPIIGDGAGVWSWIHADDAAAATVSALERGQRGVYNIVDDEPAAVSVWLPYLAETVGGKPPRRVPRWLGRALAGRAAVRWMTEGRGASNEKAKRELDWSPRWSSWRDGFVHGLAEDETPAGSSSSIAA